MTARAGAGRPAEAEATPAWRALEGGLGHLAAGRAVEGVAALEESIRLDPLFVPGYVVLADVLAAAGRGDQAETILLAGLAESPESLDLALPATGLLEGRGALPEALGVIEAAAVGAPDDPRVLQQLTVLRMATGDAKGALEAARRRTRAFPDDAEAHTDLGVVLESAGRHEEAAACYCRALDLAGESKGAWRATANLGEILAAEEGGAGAAGLELLERAAALAPATELAPRWNLALALWNRDERDRAIVLVREVAASPDGDDEVRDAARRFLEAAG